MRRIPFIRLKNIFILMGIIFILVGVTYFIIKIFDWKQQKEIIRRFEKVVVEDKNCTTLQQQVNTFFEELNYCETIFDCTVKKGVYFSCGYPVNKSLDEETFQSIRSQANGALGEICPLTSVCNMMEGKLNCVNKKCRVEF